MLLHLVLLATACLLAFANTLDNEYHLDDFGRIVGNPEINRVSPIWRHFVDPATSSALPTTVQYRPLLPLSLSLNAAVGDALGVERLRAFHWGNIGIHTLTVVLLYLMLREILGHWAALPRDLISRHPTLAFLAALLFAVHPVSGVPVNYLAARDLLLMQLFLTASLLVYVRMRRRGGSAFGWFLSLALLALSIFSKTNAVAAPLLIFAFEFFLARERLASLRLWTRVLPFALLAGSFFVLTELVLAFSDVGQLVVNRSLLEYPLTQLKLHFAYYLRNFLWPFQMRPLPRLEPAQGFLDPLIWCGFLLVAGSLYAAWRLRRRLPALSFCIAAYWILLLPTSSLLPFRLLATDYRQYPSLPFLCLLGVILIFSLAGRRWQWLLATAVVLYFGVGTFVMNRVWATEETLWGHSVKHGANSIAHLNYARSLLRKDDQQAEFHMQESLSLDPTNVFTHINLGLLYMRTGREEQGLNLVRRAVELAPNWGVSHYWLSKALAQLGRTEAAAKESAIASNLEPKNVEWAYQAAWDAQIVGDYAASLEYLERVHRLGDAYKQSLFLRAFAHQKLGSLRKAIEDYRRYLEQRPDDAQARFNLGYALMETGSCSDAIGEFEKTLLLRPDYHEVHLHLARCFEALGQPERASRHAREYQRRTGRNVEEPG